MGIFGTILVLALFICGFKITEAVLGSSPDFDFENYHEFPEIEHYVREAAWRNPSFVQLRQIGKSNEGRALVGVKIAREWPAFHLSVYFIDQLIRGYEVDPVITNYVNKLNIYVFPVLNPDGFIFSRTSKKSIIRQWRKNRAPANCTGYVNNKRRPMCCEGVDLNRNYDIAFKQTNYPFNNPCSDEFQGPFPFSEPESRAVRDFVLSPEINGKVHAMVSLHTHGQLFILPYNYHKQTYPEDYQELLGLAQQVSETIRALHGTEYRLGTAPDMLGAPATGGATDWIKKNTLIKYVYVIELPPELTTWFAFQMRAHHLLSTAKETWHGMKVVINRILIEYA
uniref:Peptidase M14 carboxypeptidase A domain-containing protein n=1 Tax=Acrobeloides nanus TaxID=290746 RepID=A0A914CH28_9BILA